MLIAELVVRLLIVIGTWKLFEKCGKKGWLALIPLANEYVLAVCARREKEAKKLVVTKGLMQVITIVQVFQDEESNGYLVSSLTLLVVIVPYLVYCVRVYLGLCEVFGQKKRWLWLWIVAEFVPLLVWGFGKKYQPVAVEEIHEQAAELSGIKSDGTDSDLTINIEDRVVRSFTKKKTLLRDIHMNIQPGHMVLLLGGSGAGKTTFLNAVTGYEKANATIELGSGDVYKDYKSMKYDIGFVPQQDLMRGSDTIYRTIADAAALRLPTEIKSAERKKLINDTLDIFGLGMLGSSLVDKLSGGQRKRLSIAMEFISDPKLFILDEPDSGLDGVVARGLFEKLRDIADSGKIVIVITHTPDRVIDLFDDVIVLAKDAERSGRLTFFGPIKEAYEFFDKDSMEGILLAINQKEEGGEGRADELVRKYTALAMSRTGGAVS